jgi:hypothetical protein
MARVDLSAYPPTLRSRDYKDIMSIGETLFRRQLKSGRCDVPPCMVAPYRWRKADLQEYLDTIDLAQDRRVKGKAKRARLKAVA